MKDWFRHDADAWMDEKLVGLRLEHGLEGYGFFWAIAERLRLAKDYRLKNNPKLIAAMFGIDARKAEQLLCTCIALALFEVDENGCFFSPSMVARMASYESIIESRKSAAKTRWDKTKEKREKKPESSTNSDTKCTCNASGNAHAMQSIRSNTVHLDPLLLETSTALEGNQGSSCAGAGEPEPKRARKPKPPKPVEEQAPLIAGCEFARASDDELNKAREVWRGRGISLLHFQNAIAELESWLAADTPTAKQARNAQTHYRRLFAPWCIEKAQQHSNNGKRAAAPLTKKEKNDAVFAKYLKPETEIISDDEERNGRVVEVDFRTVS